MGSFDTTTASTPFASIIISKLGGSWETSIFSGGSSVFGDSDGGVAEKGNKCKLLSETLSVLFIAAVVTRLCRRRRPCRIVPAGPSPHCCCQSTCSKFSVQCLKFVSLSSANRCRLELIAHLYALGQRHHGRLEQLVDRLQSDHFHSRMHSFRLPLYRHPAFLRFLNN